MGENETKINTAEVVFSDATAAAANAELPDVELPDETPECVPALGDLDVKVAAVIETGAAFIKSFLAFAGALFQRAAQALTATAGEYSELAKQLQILANGGVTTEALQRAKSEHPRVRHLAEHGSKRRTRKKNRNRLIKYAKQIEQRGTKSHEV